MEWWSGGSVGFVKFFCVNPGRKTKESGFKESGLSIFLSTVERESGESGFQGVRAPFLRHTQGVSAPFLEPPHDRCKEQSPYYPITPSPHHPSTLLLLTFLLIEPFD